MYEYKLINSKKLDEILEALRMSHYKLILIVEHSEKEMPEYSEQIKDEIKKWALSKGGETLDIEEILLEQENIFDEYSRVGDEVSDYIKKYFHKKSGEVEGPIYVENAEILFSKEYGQIDAVHLLKYSSREIPIVTVMPLRLNYNNTKATYGNPEDEDYRSDIDINEVYTLFIKEVLI